jgi:hypothetical protein
MHLSFRSRTLTSAAALALAGGLALAAPAAYASGSPSGTISGTVNVGSTLTLALSATSFSLAATPGATTSTPTSGTGAITATVSTNDTKGYSVDESLNLVGGSGPSAASYGFGVASGSGGPTDFIAPSQITPWEYASGAGSSAAFTTAFTGPGTSAPPAIAIASQAVASAMSGDVYDLAWQFILPSNQIASAYTGSIGVLLVGN